MNAAIVGTTATRLVPTYALAAIIKPCATPACHPRKDSYARFSRRMKLKLPTSDSMQIRIHRSDGKTGQYSQDDPRRADVLAARFDPATVFTSGPIVIGVFNPFNVLNPDEICWIELRGVEVPRHRLPAMVEQIRLVPGRAEYEALLAAHWPQWRKHGGGHGLAEALIEVSLKNGESLFLQVIARDEHVDLASAVFGSGAICAHGADGTAVLINPKGIVRARVYHSRDKVEYPNGIWVAESDDI
jgi:hypothetical protein